MSATYVITFRVKEGQADRFRSLLDPVLDAMRHETTFIRAALHENPERPTVFQLHETWQDHEDVLNIQLQRAIFPVPSLAMYAGYSRGLENSGSAPQNASNRNEPLPAIITDQRDVGLRWMVSKDVSVIAGAFDLRKPYFGYDQATRYTQVGVTRSRGAELSVSGHVARGLDVVAAAVLLNPQVQRDPTAQGDIGPLAVGIPGRTINLNVDWEAEKLRGLSLDAALTYSGTTVATTDNRLSLPPRTTIDLGWRYRFRLARSNAALRIQVKNALDARGFNVVASGVYRTATQRYLTAYLTADL